MKPHEEPSRFLATSFGVFVAYAVLAIGYLRPIWHRYTNHLAPDPGDPIFNLYILEWGKQQLRLGLPDFWNANFFWPLSDAFTLSDHLIGPAVQALALDALLGGPIAAYNALMFLSFPLSALATYLVLRWTGLGRAAAFAGGLAFAFSPYRWLQLSHLQVLLVQWIPLTLWFWDRLLAEPRARYAMGFLAFYLLHVTGGNYLAYMIHLPLAVLAVNRAAAWRSWLSLRGLRVLAPTGLAAAGAMAALFVPYLESSLRILLTRGADNFREFGANLPSLLAPSPWNLYFHLVERPLSALTASADPTRWVAEKSLFPGLLPSVLAVVGAISIRARYRTPPRHRLTGGRRVFLGLLAAAAAAIFAAADLYSLGWWPAEATGPLRPGAVYSIGGGLTVLLLVGWAVPRRVWGGNWPLDLAAMSVWRRGLLASGAVSLALCFPLFFTPLAKLLPGMATMRVPCRFYPFASFALAYLAGVGLEALLARLKSPASRRLAAAALFAAFLVELTPRVPWARVPTRAEFPAVYDWLAGRDDVRALLELPLRVNAGEALYMYYSTAHWKPIVNGFSGYLPPWYVTLKDICCRPMPDRQGLAMLRHMGVSHLVVHEGGMRRRRRQRFDEWLQLFTGGAFPGVREVYRDDAGDRVYALAPTPE